MRKQQFNILATRICLFTQEAWVNKFITEVSVEISGNFLSGLKSDPESVNLQKTKR
jgi:hypothetical protein